ncbi:transposase [Paraburkholderia phenoliruptrix]|uniref:Transposase n=1 Tax=Paraburkholderia phenoliruptrix TaxID=252970 RepID=A0ABV3WKS2_9BURK
MNPSERHPQNPTSWSPNSTRTNKEIYNQHRAMPNPAESVTFPKSAVTFAEIRSSVLEQIEALLLRQLNAVLPQSAFGKALNYLQGQWPKLTRYIESGTWPISNNPCENEIRPFTVGRKNWLFYDTVAGANAAANLYSLIETCKANSVEPYGYLVALFKALPG